ncbi:MULTISPECIES: sterol carrier family protein [Saccharopolyspora]|uniref:Sterol carrier family protein n=1 Tax=Saccharopolyspora gregorii TaxID=33914 RepID=A0ABP6S0F2_9PSEU|nr:MULTISPECIES: sterol carrier family protein [Saccharopolyspora]MCA1188922.1 sterol carrier family protein [Saccharopolyspora sp. 6T]MCA1192943.1 sterol carrier family protein [Saccharopolyspora sp. 6V]MCA1226771.1 sterol carrier family protein [Saccharopolyspora sp. 6M]MCA1282038.1 sterol carrier family protein [Saccharopolyspora sp. 7B]
MPPRRRVDPHELRAAIDAVAPWLADEARRPARAETAAAVRSSLRTLEEIAPGRTVEVRVPPYAAVQCVAGPEHTRGTPPNVIETDPRTWLLLATGELDFATAVEDGRVSASGSRADLTAWLPLVRAS